MPQGRKLTHKCAGILKLCRYTATKLLLLLKLLLQRTTTKVNNCYSITILLLLAITIRFTITLRSIIFVLLAIAIHEDYLWLVMITYVQLWLLMSNYD